MIFVLCAVLLIVLLLVIALIRTLLAPVKAPAYAPKEDPERGLAYAEVLANMVRHETVSVSGNVNPDKFRAFHDVLRREFPLTFAACEFHDIDGGILMRWPGKSSEHPICFLAHMDVVEANADNWSVPPFSGTIKDGRVYGRGAMDDKCCLMAGFQAVEESIHEGIVPDQDIYLASSCCEETGGPVAGEIASWLKDHGVRLALLCDEGGGITEEPISGLKGLFGMAGIYEKGFGNFVFTARSKGGHSSTPPKDTPIARLASVIRDVEDHPPFVKKITPELRATFDALAPYCTFPLRYVLNNLWLFGPLFPYIFKHGEIAAMMGTTIVFTMQTGSNGANVIPQEATVTANLRYSKFEGEKACLEKLKAIASRYNVEVTVDASREATTPADLKGPGFRLVSEAMNEVYPGVPVVPYIVTGGTDSRNFEDVCDTVIRMSPMIYTRECMNTMHGIDEFLEYRCLPFGVDYFKHLIRSSGKLS